MAEGQAWKVGVEVSTRVWQAVGQGCGWEECHDGSGGMQGTRDEERMLWALPKDERKDRGAVQREGELLISCHRLCLGLGWCWAVRGVLGFGSMAGLWVLVAGTAAVLAVWLMGEGFPVTGNV